MRRSGDSFELNNSRRILCRSGMVSIKLATHFSSHIPSSSNDQTTLKPCHSALLHLTYLYEDREVPSLNNWSSGSLPMLPQKQVSVGLCSSEAGCSGYLFKMMELSYLRSPPPVLSFSISSILLLSSFFFLLYTCLQIFWYREKMRSQLCLAVGAFCASLATVNGQSSTTATTPNATTSFRSIFTVPAEAGASVPLIPNIYVSSSRVSPEEDLFCPDERHVSPDLVDLLTSVGFQSCQCPRCVSRLHSLQRCQDSIRSYCTSKYRWRCMQCLWNRR